MTAEQPDPQAVNTLNTRVVKTRVSKTSSAIWFARIALLIASALMLLPLA